MNPQKQQRESLKKLFDDVNFQFKHTVKLSYLNKKEKELLNDVINSLDILLTEYNKNTI